MKAIITEKYGSVDSLALKETAIPVPKDNEVLIKIQAASINYADLGMVKGKPFMARFFLGLLRPKFKTPGSDICGRIETVGKDVSSLRPGDIVFGDLSLSGWGGFAEYVCAHEKDITGKPANLSFEEAAAMPQAAIVALQGLRDKGHIKAGQKVLIYGASGGIGTVAVQIAKAFGAEVTAVCSTRNKDMVKQLGADQVIDYKREDFTQNHKSYDLILATSGYRSIYDYRRALNPTGIYVATGGDMAQVMQSILLGPLLSRKGGKTLGNLYAKTNYNDLLFIKELIEAGKVTPVIDRSFSLSECGRALSYYGEGHTSGKVVLSMN